MKGWVAWSVSEYADFCHLTGVSAALSDALRPEGAPPAVAEPHRATRREATGASPPEPDDLRAAIVLRHAASRARLGVRVAGEGHRLLVDVGLLGSEAYLLTRAEVRDLGGAWLPSNQVWCLALPTRLLPRSLPSLIAACGEELGVSVLGPHTPWFLLRSAGVWRLASADAAGEFPRVETGTVAGLFAGAVAEIIAGDLPPSATMEGAA